MKNKKVYYAVSILVCGLLFLSAGKPGKVWDFAEVEKGNFVCRHEVTNEEYRTFLNDLTAKGKTDKLIIAIYDSSQWITKFPKASNDPMFKMYHSHPAYNSYPIVNITLEAAQLYCEWLTEKMNALTKDKMIIGLPTDKEWRKISAPLPGNNLPWYGSFAYEPNKEKLMLTNVKFMDYASEHTNYICDGGVYTVPVKHYPPNQTGIYDIIGNVAEMTSDGKQKGGSWDNFIEECMVDKEQHYILPDPRVGFRIVAKNLSLSARK